MSSTSPLFFDTDCLSAFLWVRNESILARLYPGRIVIPQVVYSELSNPCVSHLRARIDELLSAGEAMLQDMDVGTPVYDFYRKLITAPGDGHRIIGRGEAAAIALAWVNGGIVASNNLRDISAYVKELCLLHKTTGGILKDALNAGIITESQGEVIWGNMLRCRRKLGYCTFSDYLRENP